MAFKMNRSIIKGTANHKASIAKAKQPAVAQTRTTADKSLVWAGGELGKSYIPEAIDYTIDSPEIKVPEKKELTEEEKAALAAKKAKKAKEKADRKAKKAAAKAYGVHKKDLIKNDDGDWVPEIYWNKKTEKVIRTKKNDDKHVSFTRGGKGTKESDVYSYKKGEPTGVRETSEYSEEEKKLHEELSSLSETESHRSKAYVPQEFKGEAGDKFRYRRTGETVVGKKTYSNFEFMKPGSNEWTPAGKNKKGGYTGFNAIQELYEKRRDTDELFDSPVEKKSPYKNSKSPAEMRDDRIYRHAVKGGPVRKNMRKGGYIPPNER